jgi:DNA polymerase-1
MPRLFAIDSMALFYRSYFAMIRNPLINSKGLNTSGIRGVLQQIVKIVEEDQPEYLAVASDASEPTFRHQQFPEYKATREKMPEDLVEQLPYLPRLVEALQLPYLILPGYEADDIIGTLMRWCEEQKLEGVMVTSDKDYLQLVTEEITLLNHKGERVGLDGVTEKFGCAPEQVIEVLGLMGDASDNIPGVRGVGEKTAIKLVQEFGSIPRIYENLANISSKSVRKKLEEGRENALLSRELVTIYREVPLTATLEDLHLEKVNLYENDAFHEILRELEFHTLLKRFAGGTSKSTQGAKSAKAESQIEEPPTPEGITEVPHFQHETKGPSELEAWLQTLEDTADVTVAVQPETIVSSKRESQLVGVAFCTNAAASFYVPNDQQTLPLLRRFFENESLQKVLHHVKPFWQVCRNQDIALRGVLGDVTIASHLTDPLEKRFDLDFLLTRRLQQQRSERHTEAEPAQLSMLPEASSSNVALQCESVVIVWQLWQHLASQLQRNQLWELYQHIELPLAHSLAKMEYEGIAIDTEQLASISREFEKRLNDLRSTVHNLADHEFNLNSVVELQSVLYEKFKLHEACGIKPKKIKLGNGMSTDEETLEKMQEYPLPRTILEYRALNKLKNTYVDQLPTYVHPATHRIHSTFHQVATATGRLSSDNPNLQNIPIRSAEGRRIRKVFIPSQPDRVLLAADYSQIELRVVAHYSKDPTFLEAYRQRLDIHALTAAAIFQVAESDVTRELRSKAKEVNFGLIYRMGPERLSMVTQTSKSEAKRFIEAYFQKYATIHALQEHFLEKARKEGYATTLFGRRRYLPEINGKGLQKRMAEGAAINTPIQGSAAEIIKLAMLAVDRRLRREQLATQMVLSVHDELVFEAPRDEVDTVQALIRQEMEQVVLLEVPLVVEVGVGENWLEAH